MVAHPTTATNSNCGNSSNGWDVGDMSQVEISLAVNGVHDTTSVRCCSYDGNSCESDKGGVCHLDKTFVEATGCGQSITPIDEFLHVSEGGMTLHDGRINMTAIFLKFQNMFII